MIGMGSMREGYGKRKEKGKEKEKSGLGERTDKILPMPEEE